MHIRIGIGYRDPPSLRFFMILETIIVNLYDSYPARKWLGNYFDACSLEAHYANCVY